MNVGLSFHLQPFMPAIQAAKNSGGSWVAPLTWVTVKGVVLISSLWGAVSLSWLLLRVHRNLAEDLKLDFHGVCFTALAIAALPVAFTIYICGWWATGPCGGLWKSRRGDWAWKPMWFSQGFGITRNWPISIAMRTCS